MSDPVLERLQTEAQLAKNGDHPILAGSFELAIGEIKQLREALADSLRMLDAVRFTVGLGKKQMERIAKARALLSPHQVDPAA